MQLIRRLRIPALFCALAVLVCELIAHPYTTMGVCDDGPYILMAHTLATTGHITFNGWSAAMLGWQLYLGAAFIKLFGFSYTIVRMSTLLIAMALAFVLQRTLVRANISERNATIGTLAFVLSPLYLMLSATFMSDITGLFAIVLCLYGCIQALQSNTDRSTILWLCFAILTNALCGTSRQIAWLGVLVMVPCTLWLLRNRRRVLLAGAAATFAGFLFIFVCLHWLKLQPYVIPVPLRVPTFAIAHSLLGVFTNLLDIPFLLLPIMLLFIPEVRKSTPRIVGILFFLYLLIGVHPRHPDIFLLEPTVGDWVGVHGIYEVLSLQGIIPIFLTHTMQVLLTIVSFGSLLCLIASLLRTLGKPTPTISISRLSRKQLAVLLAPFSVAYIFLLISTATTTNYLFDRYLLGLLVITLLCLVRYYQDHVQPKFPLVSVLLVAIFAIYGVAVTHNLFSLYRARVALADELAANGVPPTSVDNGWEYNFDIELQHAPYINDARIQVPAHAHVPVPPLDGPCKVLWYDKTPHVHPLYAASFDPDTCGGPTSFAPVHYSRWLASSPGTLYAVRFAPPPTH